MTTLIGLIPDDEHVVKAREALQVAGIGAGEIRLEQDLYSYVEGVRHGDALLVVETPDDRTSEVEHILHQESGLLVHSLERG